MSPPATNALSLVPHLIRCGYADAQIKRSFPFDRDEIEVVAFAGKPWDNWSACLAAVDLHGDSRSSAERVNNLGAASVFVCGSEQIDWYGLGPHGPSEPRRIQWSEVGNAFTRHKDELAPSRIYDAKLHRPGARRGQMWFFDAGLMPAVEKNRGEELTRTVERVIDGLTDSLGTRLSKRQGQEDLYRTVFWLLAAKILQDKGVENFRRLNLLDVGEVFARIGKHHGATNRFPPFGKPGRPAVDAAAHTIASIGSLADVASESLVHVYEEALIDKSAGKKHDAKRSDQYDIRKELGIHSTPTVLVNHILSQLWPLIETIPDEERHVFEPACGHAPFLTGAMRWLRDWGTATEGEEKHHYLKRHLHGVEKDPFAIEIARLRLLLADEPHGNKWDIATGNMFAGDVLAKRASHARIFLTNPPYERADFLRSASSSRSKQRIKSRPKVDEVLARSLPRLEPGSVVGIVVPRGFLRSAEARDLRRTLLSEWMLTEVSTFPEGLFKHARQETAIIIGHRRKPPPAGHSLVYRRVTPADLSAFESRLHFSSQVPVSQSKFTRSDSCSLELEELEAVWEYLQASPRLGDVGALRKGLEPDEEFIEKNPSTESHKSKPGFEAVIRRAEGDYGIHELPPLAWMDFRRIPIRRSGPQPRSGVPQLLINYARAGQDRWKLRVLLDSTGFVATRRFLVLRPKLSAPPLLFLWAVLNSPVANAFVTSYGGGRDMPKRIICNIPVPEADASGVVKVCELAEIYLHAVRSPTVAPLYGHYPPDPRAALRRLDAEVLRMYDLPPRLESQLLTYFTGERRKGVPSAFPNYYPPGFTGYVPLHELISTEYTDSSAGRLAREFEPVHSKAALAALRTAERLAAGA